MSDGSLLFETGVDTSGMKKDLEQVGTVAKGVFAADIVEAFASKAGTAMADLAKGAIAVGQNFETSMSQVAATMGITTEEIANGSEDFEKLSAAAKEMGATTKYTAAEAAEGLNILAMAGLNADQSIETLPSVLSLAAAGAMDMGSAASYITGAVKGFNDEMSNAGKYADIMAKGATMANTDVNMLGAAMSSASATANAYNQSVESTSVALLRLAEQNVTGTEAATAMSRAMADLYTPTDAAQGALKELGIATYDVNGNARDFNDVVDDLNSALSGYSDEQKLAYENTIFTSFGMKAFQKMTVSTTETVERFKEGIADASGSAMQQMNTQIDNLEGKLAILNSATEAVGIEFYEIFQDTLKGSVESATDAMTRFQKEMTSGKLSKSLERLAVAVGDFAEGGIELAEDLLPKMIDGLAWLADHSKEVGSAIAGVSVSWAAYTIATEAAEIKQRILNSTMLANPALALGIAIAGLTTAMVTYSISVGKVESATDIANSKLEELTATANEALETAGSAIEDATSSFEGLEASEQHMRNLKDQIEALNSQEELSASQKAKMKSMVDELNGSLEGLNIEIDEEGHLVGTSTEQWNKNFEARLKAAKQTKALENLESLYGSLSEVEIAYAKSEADLLAVQEEREHLLNRFNLLEERKGKLAVEESVVYYDLQKQIEVLDKKEEGLLSKQEELTNSSTDLQNEINFLSEYVDKEAEATDKAAESAENLANKEKEVSESTKEMTDEMRQAVTEMAEGIGGVLEKQMETFQGFKDASEVSYESFTKNLKEQIDSMTSWSDNISELADRGINQGLLKELAEMGPEGSKYVDQFVEMSSDQLAEVNRLFEEKAKITEETKNAVAESWGNAIGEVPGVMEKELMQSPDWEKLDNSSRQKVIDSFKSSREKAKEEGGGIAEDAAEAIKDKTPEVEGATEDMANAIQDKFDDTLDPERAAQRTQAYVDRVISVLDEGSKKIEQKKSEITTDPKEDSGGSGSASGSEASFDSYASNNAIATLGGSSFNSAPKVVTKVVLEGDAGKWLSILSQENSIFQDTTGYSSL